MNRNDLRKRLALPFVLLLLAAMLPACDGGGGEGRGDTVPPFVSSVSPPGGADGAAVTNAVTAVFSEAVAPATINTSTFRLTAGGNPVAGQTAVSGRVATFTPLAPLASGTLLTATVTTGVADLAGNPLAVDFPWSFRTEAVSWLGTVQLGTSAEDAANGVATNTFGDLFVTGFTRGSLDGVTIPAGADLFLIRLNSSGSPQGIPVQLGTPADDFAEDIAADAFGNVYVVGFTQGSLDGITGPAGNDLFLIKFNASGSPTKIIQLGTLADDAASSLAVDGADNVYVAGFTRGELVLGAFQGLADIVLGKFNSLGDTLNILQLGTSADDFANDVAVDGVGNVYVAGATKGGLAGTNQGLFDLFLVKFDPAGTELWRRQLGTPADDEALGVAAAADGTVYVAGQTRGSLAGANQGNNDLFLIKFNSDGQQIWRRQLGTSDDDGAEDLALDASGNILVTGTTFGDLAANNTGLGDLFLIKFEPLFGAELWRQQLGTVADDEARGVAVGRGGGIFVTGLTFGDLAMLNQGISDLFLVKYDASGNLQ